MKTKPNSPRNNIMPVSEHMGLTHSRQSHGFTDGHFSTKGKNQIALFGCVSSPVSRPKSRFFKASPVGVLLILGFCAVFQVGKRVVQFISVLVVYVQSNWTLPYKCKHYQFVDVKGFKLWLPVNVSPEEYFEVCRFPPFLLAESVNILHQLVAFFIKDIACFAHAKRPMHNWNGFEHKKILQTRSSGCQAN